jgi:hypothetical protein
MGEFILLLATTSGSDVSMGISRQLIRVEDADLLSLAGKVNDYFDTWLPRDILWLVRQQIRKNARCGLIWNDV